MRLDVSVIQAGGPDLSWLDESDEHTHRYTCGSAAIQLSKRQGYPKTFAKLAGSRLMVGYGSAKAVRRMTSLKALAIGSMADSLSEEFMLAEYDLAAGSFKLLRDAYTTLPLFWADGGDRHVISSSFPGVLAGLPPTKLTLNHKNLTELLLLLDINQETLFYEVNLLTERSLLKIRGGRAKLELPPDRPAIQEDKTAPRHFNQALDNIVDQYAGERISPKAVFELSGGIDSATVPGYLADRRKIQPATLSMLFPGKFRTTQRAKIKAWHERFGGINKSYDIQASDYPFSRFGSETPDLPPYQFQEIYTEILDKTAALAAKQAGADTVVTGMGGDELFENVDLAKDNHEGAAEIDRRQDSKIPAIYTPAFADMLAQTLKHMDRRRTTPIPLAGRSALFGGYSRNNVYLERGLWPVSPLSDWRLFEFCQSLPIKHRANKNILRAYQQARRFPEDIYSAQVNENFGDFFDSSITSNLRPLLANLLHDSQLVTLGIIQPKTVLARFDELTSNKKAILPVNFFTLATAELILSSVKKLGFKIKT